MSTTKILRVESIKEVAEVLQVSPAWVRMLAREGKIPATKKGHCWYFNSLEVEAVRSKENSYRKIP